MSIHFIFMVSLFGNARTQEQPRLIHFSDLTGFLHLHYQMTDEKSFVEDRNVSDIFRGFLEGGIQLNAKGSIYHPNLLTFNVNANIIGNRAKDRIFSDALINNSVNNSYNVHLSFLNKKRINFELYTQSHYITAERRFLGRFFTRYKSSGIDINSTLNIFPFKLSVYNTQNSTRGIAFSEREEKSRDIDLRLTFFSKGKTNSYLTFKRKEYSESIYDIGYDSMEIMANSRHFYGIKGFSNIVSLITYNKMTGDFDLDILRVLLNNKHYLKENLYLSGAYDLIKDNSFDRSLSKQRLSGMLTHHWYESLISSVFLEGRIEDSIYQKRDVFARGFSLDYKKKIRSGLLNLHYFRSDERSRFTSHGDIVSTSETFTFSFDTITIVQQGINFASIKITDPGFSQVYILDVDYQVNVIDNAVIVTRLPGGNIPEEASVVVFYSYLSFPDFDMDTAYYRFYGHILFMKYFSLYYRKTAMENKISSQFLAPPFESFDRDEVGAKINTRYFKVQYSLGSYDSTLSSGHRSRNFKASAFADIFRNLRLSGHISLNHMTYERGDFYNRFNTYSANLSYRPRVNLSTRLTYRSITFETPNYTRSRESLLLRVQWTIRRLILELLYEHILEGHDISERLHNYFSLMIRRRF